MAKLLLDILASVVVDKTLTVFDVASSFSSTIRLELRDDRPRKLTNPLDFFDSLNDALWTKKWSAFSQSSLSAASRS